LEDENVLTRRREQVDQRREILNEIEKQEYQLLKTRKYFLDEKIEMEDFINLKKDFQDKLYQLNGQLKYVTLKLKNCIRENATWPLVDLNLLRSYKEQDIKGKRDIVSLFTPSTIIRSLKNLTY
jgi:stalled ribosome alternative rescue factor ArfA